MGKRISESSQYTNLNKKTSSLFLVAWGGPRWQRADGETGPEPWLWFPGAAERQDSRPTLRPFRKRTRISARLHWIWLKCIESGSTQFSLFSWFQGFLHPFPPALLLLPWPIYSGLGIVNSEADMLAADQSLGSFYFLWFKRLSESTTAKDEEDEEQRWVCKHFVYIFRWCLWKGGLPGWELPFPPLHCRAFNLCL